MKRSTDWLIVLLGVGLLVVAPSPALADGGADPGPAESEAPRLTASGDDWEVRLAPYIWGISITGDATVKGNTVDVDAPFKDIFEKLNAGLFGTVEARKGRFLVFFDLMYASLEDDFNTAAVPIGFGPTTVGRGPLSVAIPRVQTSLGPASVSSETTLWGVEFFGGYRVLSRPLSGLFGDAQPGDTRRFDLDLFAGGRYWNIDQEIEIEIPPVSIPGFSVSPSVTLPRGATFALPDVRVPGVTVGGADIDVDTDFEWVDPTLGARIEADLSNRFAFTLLAGIGGFGIGSASNFAWQVGGTLNYRVGERWDIQLGYSALSIDKDLGGSSNLDLLMHGPVIGFRYRFGPGGLAPAARQVAATH